MRDPERWLSDPEAPAEMSKMLEAAQATAPTAAQKAALATQLGVATTAAWSIPTLLKVLLTASAVTGSGAALFVATQPGPGETGKAPVTVVDQSAPALDEEAVPVPPLAADGAPGESEVGPENGSSERGLAPAPQDQSKDSAQPSPVPRSKTEFSSRPSQERTLVQDSAKASTSGVPRLSAKGAGSEKPSEARLLSAARGLIETDPKRALGLLDQHRTLYPNGALAQEREVLEVRALRRAGEKGAATRAAENFRKEHPDSVHHVDP